MTEQLTLSLFKCSMDPSENCYFFLYSVFYFVFKFLAALGLHCGEQAFSSNGTWASLIVAHKLSYPVACEI